MPGSATEQPRAVWCCSTCGALYHKDFPRCPADGAEVVMRRAIRCSAPFKASAEYYQFSDLPDDLALHVGVATPF